MLDLPSTGVAQMPPTKPARTHIWKAAPTKGGYHGLFAYPGVTELPVSDRNGPIVYETENDAVFGAAMALLNALANRFRHKSKSAPERYRKLTGDELAVLIAEANVTPTFLAYLYGTSQDRVIQWIDGVTDVPHPLRILLEVFKAHPEAIDTAERITETVTEARQPRGGKE